MHFRRLFQCAYSPCWCRNVWCWKRDAYFAIDQTRFQQFCENTIYNETQQWTAQKRILLFFEFRSTLYLLHAVRRAMANPMLPYSIFFVLFICHKCGKYKCSNTKMDWFIFIIFFFCAERKRIGIGATLSCEWLGFCGKNRRTHRIYFFICLLFCWKQVSFSLCFAPLNFLFFFVFFLLSLRIGLVHNLVLLSEPEPGKIWFERENNKNN